MTELMKCKCGGSAADGHLLVTTCVVTCKCGRQGPWADSKAEAVTAWNADRLAEEKAREALHHAFGLITEPGDWDSATIEGEISEGLRLLEGR